MDCRRKERYNPAFQPTPGLAVLPVSAAAPTLSSFRFCCPVRLNAIMLHRLPPMSPAESIARLQRLLAHAEGDLAAECLAAIEDGEVVLNNRGRAEAATYHHAHRTLRDRYREDQGNEAGTVGYDPTLAKLAEFDGEVWSESVVAPQCVFIVFSTADDSEGGECIGVLRNPNHNLSLLDGLRTLVGSRPDMEDVPPGPGARFRRGELIEVW